MACFGAGAPPHTRPPEAANAARAQPNLPPGRTAARAKASRRRRRPPSEGKGKRATNGTRTRDIQDHNLALYHLS